MRILITALIGFFLIVIAAGASGVGVYLWQKDLADKAKVDSDNTINQLRQENDDLKSQIKVLQNSSTTTPSSNTSTNGTIEGTLGYPASVIPADMKVCAEDIATAKITCTSDHIKSSAYSTGEGYKLNVPAGSYYVYASVIKSDGTEWKAYYNEFVTCGLQASCTSHKKITVSVTAGKTTSSIDPQDWYQ